MATRAQNEAAIRATARFDADETAVMARELESIEKVVTETRYPDLKALLFVPMIPGIDPGADTYTWRRSDKAGEAKLVSNMGDDLPKVDVNISENYAAIRSYGDKYAYTVQELKAFALARARGSSISIDTERAKVARLLIERKVDRVIALGEPDVGGNAVITGFINDSGVNVTTAPNGNWASNTAQQILQDLQAAEKAVYRQSKETIVPDTMLLPIEQYAIAKQTPLGVNNDKTVLDFFVDHSIGIKNVFPWYLLAGAGAGSTDRIVCYKRDVMVAGAVLPQVFEAMPPQPRDLAFEVPCHARCGGTVIRYPLGVTYMDLTAISQ